MTLDMHNSLLTNSRLIDRYNETYNFSDLDRVLTTATLEDLQSSLDTILEETNAFIPIPPDPIRDGTDATMGNTTVSPSITWSAGSIDSFGSRVFTTRNTSIPPGTLLPDGTIGYTSSNYYRIGPIQYSTFDHKMYFNDKEIDLGEDGKGFIEFIEGLRNRDPLHIPNSQERKEILEGRLGKKLSIDPKINEVFYIGILYGIDFASKRA